MQILLCGGGNAIHVLGSKICGKTSGHSVHILSLFADEAEKFNKALEGEMGLRCVDATGQVSSVGMPTKISKIPSEVVPGSDVIILSLPAFLHEMYLKELAPHLKDGVIIGSLPGLGGFDLCARDILGEERANKCVWFGTETLPWTCRILNYGKEVELLSTKAQVDIAVSPSYEKDMVIGLLKSLIGDRPILHPCGSFLSVTLMNINSVWHPSITFCAYRDWDMKTPFKTVPLFYQGVDDFAESKLTSLSDEIVGIKKKLNELYPSLDVNGVRHVKEYMLITYGDNIKDKSTLKTILQTNVGYRGLTLPMKDVSEGKHNGVANGTAAGGEKLYMPDFQHRYLTEDLPCGLVVTKGIAELVGLDTPHLDSIILWCQERAGKEYMCKSSKKVGGKDVKESRCPQRYGFKDLDTFIQKNQYLV